MFHNIVFFFSVKKRSLSYNLSNFKKVLQCSISFVNELIKSKIVNKIYKNCISYLY